MFAIENIPQTIRQDYVKDNIPLITTNLLSLYDYALPRERIIGLNWYKIAHVMTDNIARYHVKSLSDIAGIIAALSPGVQWSINVSNAIDILNYGNAAKVSTYNANKDKAVKIDNGHNPLLTLGGNKVLSFYDNIINPLSSDSVAIDRHAVRAATLLDLDTAQKFISTDNKYNYVKQAYTIAARALNMLPLQIQAITWLVYKRLFVRDDRLLQLPDYVFADNSTFTDKAFINAWNIVKQDNSTTGI